LAEQRRGEVRLADSRVGAGDEKRFGDGNGQKSYWLFIIG
jgi:hypothetical protein